jgi:hypothetical protein
MECEGDKKMRNLYNLTARFQFLYEKDEFDHDEMMDLIKTGDDLKSGVCELGKLALCKKAELHAVQEKIRAAKERAASLEKQINTITYTSKVAMCALNLTKIDDDPEVILSIKKNPHSVNVINESIIPENYIKIETIQKILKREILEDLKKGVDVPGCEMVQEQRLEIK